jgi:peroxiredoxin/outer membrane lipoprotein-sorting protein
MELLQRVENRYRGLENYYVEGVFTVVADVMGFSQALDAPFVMAGKAPGKMRMEIDHEALGVLVVSDGEATWSYFAAFGEYKKETAVPVGPGISDAAEGISGGGTPTIGGNFLSYYSSFDPAELSARSIGRETVAGASGDLECEVIETTYRQPDSLEATLGPDTLWVDPQNALVVQSVHNVASDVQGMPMKTRILLEYDILDMDALAPDSLFVFTPPGGAKLVEKLSIGEASADLVGKPALDFKLSALEGKAYRLEDLRGKVVLIDFWATWCPPCRRELPAIEKIYRDYREKGLVVLAVTSEPKGVAASFIEKHGYTFPVLIDVEQTVFDKYAVRSIPVVIVVDRQGQISAHFTGFRDESELVSAIHRAGIEQ